MHKRCTNATIVTETESSDVQLLDKWTKSREIEGLIDIGRDFKLELDKFRLQIRYAIMALLSERKVLLFNPTIVPLMQDLIS